jgi:hypothetical protein
MTVAVSEGTFQKSVDVLVRNFKFEDADTKDFGAFTAGYDVKMHLEGGSVDLRSDNTIQVRELDIKWDRLKVILGLDIPEICVGGGCINMPWPIPDICLPKACASAIGHSIAPVCHLVAQNSASRQHPGALLRLERTAAVA